MDACPNGVSLSATSACRIPKGMTSSLRNGGSSPHRWIPIFRARGFMSKKSSHRVLLLRSGNVRQHMCSRNRMCCPDIGGAHGFNGMGLCAPCNVPRSRQAGAPLGAAGSREFPHLRLATRENGCRAVRSPGSGRAALSLLGKGFMIGVTQRVSALLALIFSLS